MINKILNWLRPKSPCHNKPMKIDRNCNNDRKCQRRDNKFGVTWCVKCGKLFTKPANKPMTDEDRKRFNCL